MTRNRCFGNKPGQEFYAHYHDHEWGIPQHDDRALFELLILEGAQAGLSWETILKKREGYKKAFYNFNPQQIVNMSDDELDALTENSEIIRNRLKIYATRKNSMAFLKIQKEFDSFNNYLWAYVTTPPAKNKCETYAELPTETDISRALSKDLKKRGMKFVGPTIMYAYMQAVGMVNDHLMGCWKYNHSKKIPYVVKIK